MSIDRDTITVRNLQIPNDVLAPNVWGEQKTQPALVTVRIALREGINSTASKDELDRNTIHYGELAKRIRTATSSAQHAILLPTLLSAVETQTQAMGMREDGSCRLAEIESTVTLPKASMHGDCVELSRTTKFDGLGKIESRILSFRLRDVKIMTLVGVNAYERTAKQPLIVDLQLSPVDPMSEAGRIETLFIAETVLVQLMQDSSFETLESLACSVLKDLETELLSRKGITLEQCKIRIDKPRAIAFADCPSVEISRSQKSRA